MSCLKLFDEMIKHRRGSGVWLNKEYADACYSLVKDGLLALMNRTSNRFDQIFCFSVTKPQLMIMAREYCRSRCTLISFGMELATFPVAPYEQGTGEDSSHNNREPSPSRHFSQGCTEEKDVKKANEQEYG